MMKLFVTFLVSVMFTIGLTANPAHPQPPPTAGTGTPFTAEVIILTCSQPDLATPLSLTNIDPPTDLDDCEIGSTCATCLKEVLNLGVPPAHSNTPSPIIRITPITGGELGEGFGGSGVRIVDIYFKGGETIRGR